MQLKQWLISLFNLKADQQMDVPKEMQIQSMEPGSMNDIKAKTAEFINDSVKEAQIQASDLVNAIESGIGELETKTRDFRQSLNEKATSAIKKTDEYLDQLAEKAQKSETDSTDIDGDGLADHPADFGPSVSHRHDSFFDRAETWLQDHSKKDQVPAKEKDSDESKNDSGRPTLELPKD